MHDPMAFPMAMVPFPRYAADREVASSGRLVPTATTVRPTTSCGTSYSRAIRTAPSTSRCAPSISPPTPTTRKPRFRSIDARTGNRSATSS